MSSNALDAGQYSDASIDHYEAIFGRDFVSPGGEAMARELVARMDLPVGSRVLDVGCGLGGAAFLMATEFGLEVDGIDLSANMIQRATARRDALGLQSTVALALGDCLELDAEGAYDAIHSRDVFLHIHDKARLFRVLHRALKPGGLLLFTDYCCGDKPWRTAFSEYVASRDYSLHTVAECRGFLEDAGFAALEGADWTGRFIRCLQEEAGRIGAAGFDPEVSAELRRSWHDKIERAESGDHRWGLFIATRPSPGDGQEEPGP